MLRQSVREEITTKMSHIVLITSIFLYSFLGILLIISTRDPLDHLELFNLPGVITALQMLISVYLVLQLKKLGLKTALFLNFCSILSAAFFTITTRTIEALPGLFIYTSLGSILLLIDRYQCQVRTYLREIEEHRKLLEKKEEHLLRLAYTDSLTSLPNRDYFQEKLEKKLASSSEHLSSFWVAILDLDTFKNVNDSLGHEAGDKILKETGRRLSSIRREQTIIARAGGDEFLFMVSDTKTEQEMKEYLKEIQGVFLTPMTVEGRSFQIAASIGVAVYPADGITGLELLKNADMAMYESKYLGKNTVTLCDASIKEKVRRSTTLLFHLQGALERKEFHLVYQPQLSGRNHHIIAFEALLRWTSSETGPVSPGEFIPLAEKSGLIHELGLWVFQKACQDQRTMQKHHPYPLYLSINLSLQQLLDPTFCEKVKNILYEESADASRIVLEVTESVAFHHDSRVIDNLMLLKRLGFLVALDDFGKDYSSLGRITYLHVDILKIDMDFIRRIDEGNQKDLAIIRSIIQLSRNLGAKVLAEGVENEAQRNFLQAEGCDYLQGYFFHKGLSLNDALDLLKNTSSSEAAV
ncbi:putative bifunctional diguanylate cyclase/phosphodiesterase [Proteiniclasticum ruminis]|uniref:Diguanylate cyclase (GGDEF) domain-containing protein n=1 Tax=Proteiniclasticum ruminis TaxID=398199 RepID=A0A1I5E452_9CLOT|nr:GGDEF domain-containing phosphodiesterase [Proteiniclasticum ruminis]SFO06177.1 diguanylate cyclase (GGDEF) domain-containing protein [Proteiniclasticum ruminis]